MNKYIIFTLLFICQSLWAQEEDGVKDKALQYKEFMEWVHDTIPTITDQYSLTNDDSTYAELNVKIIVNAEVKNGKMTILNSTSQNDNELDYIMCGLKEFHTTLPQNYKLHIEVNVLYHPSWLPDFSYDWATTNRQITLTTDKMFAIYEFYRYIDSAYVYDKRTKQGKMLYHEELKDIYR